MIWSAKLRKELHIEGGKMNPEIRNENGCLIRHQCRMIVEGTVHTISASKYCFFPFCAALC